MEEVICVCVSIPSKMTGFFHLFCKSVHVSEIRLSEYSTVLLMHTNFFEYAVTHDNCVIYKHFNLSRGLEDFI